jgi:uncharacterized protein YbjT (DUF2867 family)
MILVAGGTGVLGGAVVERLLDGGRAVRILTRDPSRASRWVQRGAEAVQGDLRDRTSLARACAGTTHVFTTANAFMGRGEQSVAAVDEQGNRNLVDAARCAGVRQFVFTSALLPPAYRSIDFFAAKFATEAYLQRSGLTWTILRPTAFMDTWADIVGRPLVTTGKTMIFGKGDQPINFVAVDNVAEVAVMTLDNPDASNAVVEIVGPENLTLNEVADVFERVTGTRGKRTYMPGWVLRVMSGVARPFNPVFARQVAAGAVMGQTTTAADPTPMLARYPVALITLEEWVRRRFPPQATLS